MASLNRILSSCTGSIHHQQYVRLLMIEPSRIPLWQDAQASATVTDCWLPPPDAPITIGLGLVNQKAGYGYMSALATSFFNFVSISGHTARKPQETHITTDFAFTFPEWKQTKIKRNVAESLSAAKSQASAVDRLFIRLHASHLATG